MKQITVAIAGLGGRGKDCYAKIQKKIPEQMKIVAIADVIPSKVEVVKKEYGVSDDMCFESAEEMLSRPKLADVMFICTMDRQHYAHAMAALDLGYDLLLEKPISPDLKECKEIAAKANALGRKVVVCHVLRYTPFYQTLKAQLESGKIGDVVAIQAMEQVGYWHQAHSFVRGNWRNSTETSPMILQKACHDMDILTWLAGSDCKSISSVGGLKEFRADRAPEGAAMRCTECDLKDTCPFSAVKYYVGKVSRGETGWPANIVLPDATPETMLEELKTSPYGRCVYHCDNDVVDHQMVQMTMENGIIINFVMSAFTIGGRDLRVLGTRGMIVADMDKGTVKVGTYNGNGGLDEENIDVFALTDDFSGHGGGDIRLVKDLFEIVAGEKSESSALTSIDKSVESHFMSMAAEASRLSGGVLIDMKEFAAKF